MKEFERQICSPSGQKKMWEDAKPFVMNFFVSCSLTTPFQKSDLYLQCQQGGLKQGQSLKKEHRDSKYLRYVAVVSLPADLKRDTRRRL